MTKPSRRDQSLSVNQSTRRDFIRTATSISAAGVLAGVFPAESVGTSRHEIRVVDDPAKAAQPLKILILGGTGFLGPHIVEHAIARGHTMTLFNRGKTNPQLFPDVEKLLGDRNGDLESLKGRTWDAVVDTSGYTVKQVRDSAGLLKDAANQYVFISTVSVYANTRTIGMDESAPVAKLPEGIDESTEQVAVETYGPLKALCEREAEAAFPGRATNIRPGLIVGPGDRTDRYTYWAVRVAKGGEVLAPGSASDPVQYVDVRDLAEWIVKVLEDSTFGVFNAVGPMPALSMGPMLEACKEASGKSGGGDAMFVWVDADFLEAQGVRAWTDMPMWVPPVGDLVGFARLDASKAIARGLGSRLPVVTAKDTLEWWKGLDEERRTGKMRAGLTAEREAEVLAAWKAAAKK